MDKVIHLLRERNKFLAKFSALNGAEIQKITTGNFETIEAFYQTREDLLELIKNIETLIEKRLAFSKDSGNLAPSLRRSCAELLRERDELVNQILAQDLEILSCIDQAKNSIIQELQQLRRNRKVIGSYKSGNRQNLVDEEA